MSIEDDGPDTDESALPHGPVPEWAASDWGVTEPGGPAEAYANPWDDDAETAVVPAFASGYFFADRFRIGALLGSGAMGRVYAATDLATGTDVALKVLHGEGAKDPEVIARFAREAEILRALGHPAIVRVHAVGSAERGRPWLAMELLHGETLKERLRRGPYADPYAIVPVISALSDALAAAHAQGVVHRDLKPENIVLLASAPGSTAPACKVLDFGLSRLVGSSKLTRTGTLMGTPRYMAPELIRSVEAADHRVDQFSAGVILFEMLTGLSPYDADDQGQLFGRIMSGTVRRLSELRPDLPPAVEQVIQRAMSLDRAARFATMGALAEAYATALGVASGRSMLVGPLGLGPGLAEGSRPLVDPYATSTPLDAGSLSTAQLARVASAGPAAPGARSSAPPARGPSPHSPARAMASPLIAAPPEFTRPSTPAPPPPRVSAPEPPPTSSRPMWIAFGCAALVVAALAAAGAVALRFWMGS